MPAPVGEKTPNGAASPAVEEAPSSWGGDSHPPPQHNMDAPAGGPVNTMVTFDTDKGKVTTQATEGKEVQGQGQSHENQENRPEEVDPLMVDSKKDAVNDPQQTDPSDTKLESVSEDDPDTIIRCGRACTRRVQIVQNHVHGFLTKRGKIIKLVFIILLLIIYTVYFIYAIWYSPSGALVLIVLTSIVALTWILKFINLKWGKKINRNVCVPIARIYTRKWWKRYVRR